MHPLVVKKLLLPLHERMLHRGTFEVLRGLEQSQWWPTDRLRALQQGKLRRLLTRAHDRCPFYRRRIDEAGIDPARITLDQLSRLPTLTKSDITENRDAMIDPSVRGGLHDCATGGSTGVPLAFKIDRERQAADQAARARTRRWFGIDVGERELYLWGSPVELAAVDHVKAIRDRLTNHRLLNAFRMTPRVMSGFLDEIRRFDPVHIFGYPSSIARLVRHAIACGRSIQSRSLRAVFVTGELFQASDRAVIEESVTVPVVDGYGAREAGFIAHQCPAGTYHVTMESLIVELLHPTGDAHAPLTNRQSSIGNRQSATPVATGEPGEITITHLDAYGMPFIRYRTGDIARHATADCPCGRGLEALDIIEGRRTDMLRTSAGGVAHALSVIYVLRDEPTVREFKVVQQSNLDLDVLIIPRGPFEETCRRRITESLKRQIGRDIDVRIQLTEEIQPDPSGKHRYVVSHNEG